MGAPNHCGGRPTMPKVPKMSQVLSSIQYIRFRTISGSNLLLAPGSI